MRHLALSLILVVSVGAQAAKFQRVIGEKFPDVKVQDLHSNKEIDLSAKLKSDGIKGAVVIFTCEGCPVAVEYQGRIDAVIQKHSKDILFIQLNSNAASETAESWTNHTKEKGHKGFVAIDADSRIAKGIGASVTPEAYLLDKSGKVVYHGPIDDSRDEKYLENKLLDDAISALLSGKEIAEDKREVQASGCGIRFPE